MVNTFMTNMKNATNYKLTDNGAIVHKTTNSAVYDLFALGGAYRNHNDADCQLLFKNAYEEDKTLALKCLFYLRDIRGGGQGERRFFRVCYKWLAENDKPVAIKLLNQIAEYGRWDDLIYIALGTRVEKEMFKIVRAQLNLDIECKTPSLLGKWMPSENASSPKTKAAATKLRVAFGWSHKQYRKLLSELRKRINIVERLMSENRWDEIEFDKIPSRAGIIYKNAFARRDIIAKKYEAFVKDENTTVNAGALYPYDVVKQVTSKLDYWDRGPKFSEVDIAAIEKYWTNLPDYLEGAPCKMMCVVDTSGSMTSGMGGAAPIDVAISLGMYCAERVGGPFKDHYISFSSRPQLIKIEGVNFVDKVERIYKTNLCQNTNIEATFELVRQIALRPTTRPEDIPETLVIISDMQFDCATTANYGTKGITLMAGIREKWERSGLKVPRLVYWNCNAANPVIVDEGPDVSYVSGCSPIIFQQIMTGVTGYELMLQTLMAERYAPIEA